MESSPENQSPKRQDGFYREDTISLVQVNNKEFNLGIKPADSKISMYLTLDRKLQVLKSLPIEYFESELYSLCYQYSNHLHEIDLKFLCRFHPVWELKRKENNLSMEFLEILNRSVKNEMSFNPEAFSHYKILLDSMELMSGLVIKWGISNLYNILYRFQNIVATLPMIDIKNIKMRYFSVQTIALAFNVQEPPLSQIVNYECKCFGKLVLECCETALKLLLQANSQNEMNIPSIKGVLVGKNSKLKMFFNTMPSHSEQKYQTLKKQGFFKKLFNKKVDRTIEGLYEAVKNFDLAYRMFESNMLTSFISINSLKLNA